MRRDLDNMILIGKTKRRLNAVQFITLVFLVEIIIMVGLYYCIFYSSN